MTYKTIRDRQGKVWDVWEVHPTSAERRYVERRLQQADQTDTVERRSGLQRRRKRASRTAIAEEYTGGWLCFETNGEKRRLAPVPDGWDRADDDTIEQWCCCAKPVVRRSSTTAPHERGEGHEAR